MDRPRRKLGASLFEDEPEINVGIQTLPLSKLEPYHRHPFKLYSEERLNDLVESIKNVGLQSPIIVRRANGDTFEILAGHNRVNAARIAGMDEIPVIIKEGLTEEEAYLIVSETNLNQRGIEGLSESEKAITIANHMDALRSKGRRRELLDELEMLSNACGSKADEVMGGIRPREHTRDKVAGIYGMKPRQVSDYCRVAKLSRDLLERVDSGAIKRDPAVSLSYLNKSEQAMFSEFLDKGGGKVDMKKAAALRVLSEKRSFNTETMENAMSAEAKQARPAVKVKPKVVAAYFPPETPQKKIEDTIEAALKLYFAQNPQ
ncbi:hypothetical protein FACS189425_05860 [Clostridia bacterium]|nr:hypothetical protein FACS189425_05860 [Clostridia bacterium]